MGHDSLHRGLPALQPRQFTHYLLRKVTQCVIKLPLKVRWGIHRAKMASGQLPPMSCSRNNIGHVRAPEFHHPPRKGRMEVQREPVPWALLDEDPPWARGPESDEVRRVEPVTPREGLSPGGPLAPESNRSADLSPEGLRERYVLLPSENHKFGLPEVN